MTKKFAEEQYQEIINFDNFEVVYRLGLVESFVGEIIPFISKNNLQQEALAIANPLTREWAHDNFVEKEKKYRWSSKAQDEDGYLKRLYKEESGMISGYSSLKNDVGDYFGDKLTESEIKAWGYNPEMFDREEV